MRRIVVSLAIVALAAGLMAPAVRASAPPVSGTYAIADLGQGGWGGGPLYADGSVGGSGALSFSNGQVIGRVTGGTWSLGAGPTVTICLDFQQTKGPAGAIPPSLCFGPLVPGKPVVVPDSPNTLFRVTLRG
jgi:hypothetical protein